MSADDLERRRQRLLVLACRATDAVMALAKEIEPEFRATIGGSFSSLVQQPDAIMSDVTQFLVLLQANKAPSSLHGPMASARNGKRLKLVSSAPSSPT